MYRKRHRDSVNRYNRFWRKGLRQRIKVSILHEERCFFCGLKNDLVWHHLKSEEIVHLCQSCLKKFGYLDTPKLLVK